MRGRAWLFGEECDTGQIIPGKYIPLTDPDELATHVFEGIRPTFLKEMQKGDFIVAGRNFGCGSSREHAPKAIYHAGIRAVIADSFARIFYRNSLNLGLLPVIIPGISSHVKEGDILELDLRKGNLMDITSGERFSFEPYEPFIIEILEAGGIVPYTKKMLHRA